MNFKKLLRYFKKTQTLHTSGCNVRCNDIKKIIKKSFLGRYLISELHCFESWLMPKLISDKKAVLRFYKKSTDNDLDLKNPQTLSEKLNWYKLNNRLPLMQQCADKVAMRDYVTEKGYGDCLNEILGVYNCVKDIDIDDLPEKFVLKAAHGSHMNIIVTDKTKENWLQNKLMMNSWLHQNIYWSRREWVYKDMPRRIIAEKYLEDVSGELRDYKFFCFNGKPTYMQYDSGRYIGKHLRNYYDMDLNFIPVRDDVPSDESNKPDISSEVFERMKSMASDLAEPFQHVRVDFYLVNNKVFIGELTFFHNGGITWFEPPEYDEIFGSHWKINC